MTQSERHRLPILPPKPTIRRTSVFDPVAFRALLSDALRGIACFRYGGRYWEPVHLGRGFSLYRQAPDLLSRLHRRLRHYEFCFYRSLLHGYCGTDGLLRPRTRLWRRPDGAYAQFVDHGDDI